MGPILPHAALGRRGTFGPRNTAAPRGVAAGMPITGEYQPSTDERSRDQVALYESSGGTEGTTLRGMPVVVVTMLGARSGKVRKIPVMRVEHDGVYAVVASLGGDPTHPVWYHNLLAHPLVELQDGPAKADYADYQTRTSRVIPVLVLEPVGA